MQKRGWPSSVAKDKGAGWGARSIWGIGALPPTSRVPGLVPGAAITNDPKLGSLKPQRRLLSWPGGWMSAVKASAGLVPPGAPEGGSLPCLSSAPLSSWLHPSGLRLCPRGRHPVSLCPLLFLSLLRTHVIEFHSPPNQDKLILRS